MSRPLLVVLALVALLALPLGSASAANTAPSPKKQAANAFKHLRIDTKAVPKKNLKKRHKRRLLKLVATARRQSLKRPCRSVKTMRTYRKRLKLIREPRLRRFELNITTIRGALESDALAANVALLQLPRAKSCGGGKRSTVTQSAPQVVESDATHVRMKVALPPPTFVAHQVGGTTYQQVYMGGMGETGDVGDPGVPKVTQFLGVPEGADVEVTLNGSQGYDLDGVNLFPHQEEPVDLPPLPSGAPDPETFLDPPFEKDGKAYKSNGKFPPKPASGGGIGNMRDLRVGGVDFAGAQYKPKTDKLHVFTSIDVTVKFGGANTGKFGDADAFRGRWSSWFQQNYEGLVENYDAVAGNLGPAAGGVQFCGEEMLVITSPAYEPAANAFAAAKNDQGYFAKVKLTGTGAGQIGTTKEQIQSFIRGELKADCLVRPQFVVLLGNTDAVPTFVVPCKTGQTLADCDVATDLPYSLDGVGSDLFADVMLGRIPATSPANALQVVNKIVNYENTMPAPEGDDFYKHATVTGYWQPSMPCYPNAGVKGTPNCDKKNPPVTGHRDIDYRNHREVRGFTLYSDKVLKAMKSDAYTVDRLWTTDNANVVPEEYQDGSQIPSALRRPNFAWDADTQDFLDSYNGGRFLIFHRDHGWENGWGAPTLSSANIPDLTNGSKLPVVFGVNCLSARFDNPADPSFIEEQIELPTNGAVAGFGDTRVSPSNPNNHMALGFFDALFPSAAPGFGSDTPTRRLGDVLLSGKAYMATQVGFEGQNAGNTEFEHYLYHLLGDPSMQMWAASPRRFQTTQVDSKWRTVTPAGPGDPDFQVEVNFGQGSGEPPAGGTVATLLHDGDPIGRGVVGDDGRVTIEPDVKTDTNRLTVALNQEGVLPIQDPVEQGNPAQPTSLTLQGASKVTFDKPTTFTGHLDPIISGAPINVVYTRDSNGETITHSVSTDSAGNYTDTVTIPRAKAGGWKAQASYAGDVTHGASSSNVLQFTVGP
jgi:hypothetical protein